MAIETIIIPKPLSPSREAFTPHGLNAQPANRPRYAQKKKDAKKKKIPRSDAHLDQPAPIIPTKKSPYLV